MPIEIVSVTYRRGKKGQRQENDFDYWAINRPDPDEWPEALAFYDWCDKPVDPAHAGDQRFGGVFLDLPTDWLGLRFDFVGQWLEHQEGGLKWESDADGPSEVFDKWTDELKAIGDQLLDGEIKRLSAESPRIGLFAPLVPDDEIPREVTFLTAWKYEGGVDDTDGEWSAKWELLGRLDLSKIEALIVQEVAA